MFLKEIGLHAQNLLTTMGGGGGYMAYLWLIVSVDFDDSEQFKISSKTFWD